MSDDYQRWALEYPGIEYASALPVPDGPGTVWVVIMGVDRSPLPLSIIDGLQNVLDPPPVGQGHGKAPVGAEVTVKTVAVKSVNVTAVVSFKTGYSLDGTAGTLPLRLPIEEAIKAYIDNGDVGEDVVKNHIEAQFFTVEGVRDVTVSLPAADVAVNEAADPPEIARTGTITLT